MSELGGHVDIDVLDRLAAGELDEATRRSTEQHVDACESCRARLSELASDLELAAELRARETSNRRPASGHEQESSSDLHAIADEEQATRSWDAEWERAILEQCLAQARREVQPQTFRAFELTALQDRDAAQAAEELAIDVKAVYNAKHRLLQRIRELRQSMEQLT